MPSHQRTLIEQALHLRRDFPDGNTRLRPTLLVWTGRLTPTPLSHEYTVRIRYERGHYPGVRLLEPRLRPDERDLLHHLYPNGDLCLHRLEEWNSSMLIVETIIPWTTEWLAHYELWKRSHHWYGDGDMSDIARPSGDPPAIGALPTSRNERRWDARAESRRARGERRISAGGSSPPRDGAPSQRGGP